ncbi:MAG: hypothetical protein U9N49_05885 [Campylobacterota bacterium]|nr:hypothetical protein [Campylobacterota bacterium]
MKTREIFLTFASLVLIGCGNSENMNTSTPSAEGYYRSDVVISGLPYRCGHYSSATRSTGMFQFEINQSCQFYIDGALIRSFTAPNMEVVEAIETNTTILQFLYALDNDGNSSNGVHITQTSLEAIKRGRLTRMPINDHEINMVVEFLKVNDSNYSGNFISQDDLAKLKLDNILRFTYILYYNNQLNNIYLNIDSKEIQIYASYSYQLLQSINFVMQSDTLILNQEPFTFSNQSELDQLILNIDALKEEEKLLLDEYFGFEDISMEDQIFMLQEIEDLYNNEINSIKNLFTLSDANEIKHFTLKQIDAGTLIFEDQNSQLLGLFSDYDKANLFKNNIDNNTSLLNNTNQEQNGSLIFKQLPFPPVWAPVDGGDIETPSFDIDAPSLDWGVPEADDLTTFDGIRGELKKEKP